MDNGIDLDAYFARIGYAGERKPTLSVLCTIHALHPASIAFENLDSLLGRRVHLDLASIEAKLIRGGRGGYCFEHNTLLAHVLTRLGFGVSLLAARVVMGGMPATGRRTHMLLKVETEEGAVICDVGFGGRTLTAPLRLSEAGEQPTAHGPFRLLRDGAVVDQQVKIAGEWQTLYRFSLEEQLPGDFDVLNWFVSTYPESPFVSRLLAARTLSDRWYGLMNDRFSVNYPGRAAETRKLKDADEIAGVLENELGIRLPEPRDALIAGLRKLSSASD
jgi:N-hydroxyarylamine O-acetyltransferase